MCFFHSQSVIIDFLVYFGYIKDIFGDDGNNDYNGLSVKLQVIQLTLFEIPNLKIERKKKL